MSVVLNVTKSEEIIVQALRRFEPNPAYTLIFIIGLVAVLALSSVVFVYPYLNRSSPSEDESQSSGEAEDRVEIMEDHIPQRGLTTPRAYARDLGRIYVNSVSPRHARRSTCRNENNKSKSTSPFHPGYNSPVSCSTPESSKSSLKDVTNLLSLCGNIKSMTIVSPRESSSSQSSKENVLLDGITKRRRNESSAGPSPNTFESELHPSKKHETRQSTPIATFARPAERGWRESRKLKSRRRIDKHPYFVEKSKREEYKRVCARKYRETGPKAVTMFTSKGTQTPEVSDNEVLEWDYSFS